jgi:16S rRNA C1402 (ribose-2'-O) methylase RsmI
LVIGPAEKGAPGAQAQTAQSLAARVDELMHQAKLDRKDALKLAAKERGITKRDAYRQLLDENPPAHE